MNIQEQIRDLTEKFSNLFEVEGIGEPAYEVPPSTNKIKKDVKTKDGKVELVSVEDELFPKDGNKREQFRQKVIDTINGMIQGTATLEDLLQIVRSKQVKAVKEGYEGAIELLEFLVKNHSNEENPVVKITDKNYKSVSGKHLGGSFNKNQIGNYLVYNKDTDSSYLVTPDNWKKSKIKKDLEAQGKFYEAVEILEEIINEVSLKKWKESAKNSYDKRKEVADKSAEADKKSWDNYEKQSKLSPEDEPELFKKAVDQGAIAYKDKKRANHAMGVYANTPDSKHSATKYNKAILNSLKGREDKYVETGKKSDLDRAINTFHLAKLNPVKEGFEGAIELAEDITAQILKQPAEKRASLFYKLKQGLDKDIRDTYTKAQEEEKQKSKEEKGQEKTEQRKKYRGKSTEDWKLGRLMDQIARNAKNLGKTKDPATAKAIRRNAQKESLKEAMEVLEQLLGEFKSSKVVSELFDRPDLLNDIDNALGSPVKKFVKNILAGKKKEKKVKTNNACESLEEIIKVFEDWGDKTGMPYYDDSYYLNKHKQGVKKVEMSPDEYMKKASRSFRRNGVTRSHKDIVKDRTSHRETIEELKKKLQDPNVKMDVPSIEYFQKDGNRNDNQEGFHRAIAAKELGHKTIPVHIIHPTSKRSPEEKKEYKQEKVEAKKWAKDERKKRRNEVLNY